MAAQQSSALAPVEHSKTQTSPCICQQAEESDAGAWMEDDDVWLLDTPGGFSSDFLKARHPHKTPKSSVPGITQSNFSDQDNFLQAINANYSIYAICRASHRVQFSNSNLTIAFFVLIAVDLSIVSADLAGR